MGRRLRNIATTARPLLAGSPSVSIHGGQSHRFLWKRIAIKSLGAVALISIFSVAAAGQIGTTGASKTQGDTSGVMQLEATATPSPTASETSASTTLNTSTSSTADGDSRNNNSTSVQVTVNGQDVPVPQNGTTQQTVTSPDGGSTTVNVSSNTDGNGSSFNSSFTSQNINSYQSNSSTNINMEQRFGSP